ncbi:MAG: RNA 2',3'-cyclic phosphodiesterase [candidate division Zixibacteria bacterium]|nr:RNA 2',3'-cyclic phosphodiesterase [candidate division Zixibacteria bacterium]
MRSFIAINLPAQVQSDIGAIIARLRPAGPPAKWVPAENLHLTLKFLDEIREDQIDPILKAMASGCEGGSPFEIALRGFGVFPNARKARVFWIGIDSGYETLKALAQSIDTQIATLGFPREDRPFSAHITLARLREPAPAEHLMHDAVSVDYHSASIPVAQVDLMRSVLSSQGALYSVIASVPLK